MAAISESERATGFLGWSPRVVSGYHLSSVLAGGAEKELLRRVKVRVGARA